MKRSLQHLDRQRAIARHRRKGPAQPINHKPATAAISLLRQIYGVADAFKHRYRLLYHHREDVRMRRRLNFKEAMQVSRNGAMGVDRR